MLTPVLVDQLMDYMSALTDDAHATFGISRRTVCRADCPSIDDARERAGGLVAAGTVRKGHSFVP